MLRAPFAAAAALLAVGTVSAEPFTVVTIGDMPYGKPEDVYGTYETLIDTINARAPDLVIHVGDTKSGSTPCSDQMLDDQLGYLNSFEAPLMYTPGDNEWTDCHRKAAGGFDPLGRLDYIRTTYFDDPATSFGATPAQLESQGGPTPENARMMLNDVMFITAHVIGSNNNFEIRDTAAIEEFLARDAANIAWVRDSFAAATEAGAAAVVLALHADMFEAGWTADKPVWVRHSGFHAFGPAMVAAAAAFGKPVLLVYGDSHVFRQSRPFPADAPNLLALEVPGAADMHAVELSVDPATPGVFSISLLENPALATN